MSAADGLAAAMGPEGGTPAGDHRIEPLLDSWYSVGPRNAGRIANLRNQLHYPVEAVCATCHRRIVAARFLACDWVHEDRPQPGDPGR